jgi:hypothetical protein
MSLREDLSFPPRAGESLANIQVSNVHTATIFLPVTPLHSTPPHLIHIMCVCYPLQTLAQAPPRDPTPKSRISRPPSYSDLLPAQMRCDAAHGSKSGLAPLSRLPGTCCLLACSRKKVCRERDPRCWVQGWYGRLGRWPRAGVIGRCQTWGDAVCCWAGR